MPSSQRDHAMPIHVRCGITVVAASRGFRHSNPGTSSDVYSTAFLLGLVAGIMLSFVIIHLTPGDPVRLTLGVHATTEAVAAEDIPWDSTGPSASSFCVLRPGKPGRLRPLTRQGRSGEHDHLRTDLAEHRLADLSATTQILPDPTISARGDSRPRKAQPASRSTHSPTSGWSFSRCPRFLARADADSPSSD